MRLPFPGQASRRSGHGGVTSGPRTALFTQSVRLPWAFPGSKWRPGVPLRLENKGKSAIAPVGFLLGCEAALRLKGKSFSGWQDPHSTEKGRGVRDTQQ